MIELFSLPIIESERGRYYQQSGVLRVQMRWPEHICIHICMYMRIM